MKTVQSLPVIPVQEYPQRWEKTQAMMDRLGLELLVAYADDRAVFGPAHLRWLANFPVHFEPACILMPKQGKPIILCGPESDEYARLIGQVGDVRVLKEFTHPDEDYPYSKIQGLAEIVAEVIKERKSIRRVGLAGRSLMSADSLAAFQKALPGAEWVDTEEALCSLRAIKSPAEIAVIRYAYRIAEAGLSAAVEAIEVGVTEREVAAEVEAAIRRSGAEGTGIDTIVASGPNSRPILARSTMRKIQQDDLVTLTVAPRYEGYHAAIGRPVLVGQPSDPISDAVEKAVLAQQACFQALKPGIPGRDVEAIGRQIMEAAGYGSYFLYSGIHSVGVIEFEPPIFGPSSTARLEPNMVVSIDIPVFNTPWGGLRVEDGYLITQEKAEHLNKTPYLMKK
jgi:Xaa-Pro aminopeptidase